MFTGAGKGVMVEIERCAWGTSDPLYMEYHDKEWGVPVHDDGRLFEFLILEGMQAGLSWITILRKRENFRAAFDQFDPLKVASYGSEKIEALMQDAGIIRNRAKLTAAVTNAQAFLKVQQEFGTFAAYMWQFVGGRPIQNRWKSLRELPAETDESRALSKDLLRRGFKFVGPTIIYAHMQACGMVNDHLTTCFRHAQLGGEA
ncbi:DNA-3-methyladenine glycosylase I [Geitlerinema splendidum]|jgi:DNA-3-methyladenine glycosylase I|nr:DNA-3-methyladenine glycosylase I [Geitlerinema splendidum]